MSLIMTSISDYKISGKLFDGKTPAEISALLSVIPYNTIEITSDSGIKTYSFAQIKIAPRIGNIQRKIELPDGSIFYTDMNDAIDEICMSMQTQQGSRFIHMLETNLRYIAIAFMCVLAFIAGVYFIGIPYAAKQIAYNLPESVSTSLSDMTLKTFDKQYLGTTTLPEEKQAEIQTLFTNVCRYFNAPQSFKLLLRDGKDIGANAFALPGGIVIVTDQLVNSAENNDEIASIMAHEIGHALEHHALRSVLQGSSVMILLSMIMGDFISVTNLAAMVPIMMIEGKYSRNFENKADDFSYRYLQGNNLPLTSFSDILTRLDKEAIDNPVINLISTHPPTKERIKRFMQK